jgi:hypothetical protein
MAVCVTVLEIQCLRGVFRVLQQLRQCRVALRHPRQAVLLVAVPMGVEHAIHVVRHQLGLFAYLRQQLADHVLELHRYDALHHRLVNGRRQLGHMPGLFASLTIEVGYPAPELGGLRFRLPGRADVRAG